MMKRMNVLLPKGDDAIACRDAYQNQTGEEVPVFTDRRLRIFSNNATYWLMRGCDIPGLVADGRADSGVAGTDAMLRYELRTGRQLIRKRIGPEMCRFSLLADELSSSAVNDVLVRPSVTKTLRVVTSEPEILSYIGAAADLPIVDAGIPISGSVEAALLLTGADLAADIVQTGNMARAMGLTEIRTLMTVYPELVEGARQ